MTGPAKPLGRKAYGSIGHIDDSRLGPGDHHVSHGQSVIVTKKLKDPTWSVVAQTKLDGSCVSVAKLPDGEIVALGRAGYPAYSSNYEMHQMFAAWVEHNHARFDYVLQNGERIVGEWLAQAHGTIYDLTEREPFVAFDIMTEADRITYPEFFKRVSMIFPIPDSIEGPIDPKLAVAALDHYGADEPEGVVYRAEKDGKVQFLAKWVRHDKIDGKYLNGDPVWNFTWDDF